MHYVPSLKEIPVSHFIGLLCSDAKVSETSVFQPRTRRTCNIPLVRDICPWSHRHLLACWRPKLRKRGRKGRVGLLRASTPVYSDYWRPNWTAMCWCLSSPTSNSLLPLHISVLLERCSNVKNYTTETLWGVQLTGELRTRQPPSQLLC